MTTTRIPGREKLQEDFLQTVRRSQEFVLAAIRTWAEAVQSVTPKLPDVRVPLADRLPKPKDVVDGTYGFAEKVLASQRKFAAEVLEAAAPLTQGKGNGQAAKAAPRTNGHAAKATPRSK